MNTNDIIKAFRMLHFIVDENSTLTQWQAAANTVRETFGLEIALHVVTRSAACPYLPASFDWT